MSTFNEAVTFASGESATFDPGATYLSTVTFASGQNFATTDKEDRDFEITIRQITTGVDVQVVTLAGTL